jgi:hypothetical protein
MDSRLSMCERTGRRGEHQPLAIRDAITSFAPLGGRYEMFSLTSARNPFCQVSPARITVTV